MLLQVVLSLETLPANFTAESKLGALVRPLVYHQIIGLREPPLTIFTNKLALCPHFSPELISRHVVVNLHYCKHFSMVFITVGLA